MCLFMEIGNKLAAEKCKRGHDELVALVCSKASEREAAVSLTASPARLSRFHTAILLAGGGYRCRLMFRSVSDRSKQMWQKDYRFIILNSFKTKWSMLSDKTAVSLFYTSHVLVIARSYLLLTFWSCLYSLGTWYLSCVFGHSAAAPLRSTVSLIDLLLSLSLSLLRWSLCDAGGVVIAASGCWAGAVWASGVWSVVVGGSPGCCCLSVSSHAVVAGSVQPYAKSRTGWGSRCVGPLVVESVSVL